MICPNCMAELPADPDGDDRTCYFCPKCSTHFNGRAGRAWEPLGTVNAGNIDGRSIAGARLWVRHP